MATSEAPGALETVRTFLNTVALEDSPDPLAPRDELSAWCAACAVCAHIDEEGLARLRAFREALREVVVSNARDGDAEQAWARLEPFTRETSYRMRLAGNGRPELAPQGSGAEAAIAAILAVVYDAVRDGTWQRLKACRKHSCRRAFYDRSKNGSGAWCNMAVCGNRVKAQRRRSRQKAR